MIDAKSMKAVELSDDADWYSTDEVDMCANDIWNEIHHFIWTHDIVEIAVDRAEYRSGTEGLPTYTNDIVIRLTGDYRDIPER